MLFFALVGLLLLGIGNVGLVYAEKTVPSGLASLVYAVCHSMWRSSRWRCPAASLCPGADGWGCFWVSLG